jgi:hypothetical protein
MSIILSKDQYACKSPTIQGHGVNFGHGFNFFPEGLKITATK